MSADVAEVALVDTAVAKVAHGVDNIVVAAVVHIIVTATEPQRETTILATEWSLLKSSSFNNGRVYTEYTSPQNGTV